MMKQFDTVDAKDLLADKNGLRVSLFSPMEVSGNRVQQNPIRFKNLLRELDQKFDAGNADEESREKITSQLAPLLDDYDFWQHQSRGLAIFVKHGQRKIYRTGLDLEEKVAVGGQFQVLPLLPLLNPGANIAVLALSQNRVRLFAGNRYNLEELHLPEDTPQTLIEAVGKEYEEQHLQHHSGRGADRSPVYHAQGGGKDDLDADLQRFARLVGAGVSTVLSDGDLPLVLAGDPSLLATFTSVTAGDIDITEQILHGNFDRQESAAIHEQLLPIIEAHQHERLQACAERFAERFAAGTASDIYDTLEAAAREGRIETLLVRSALNGANPTGRSKLPPTPEDNKLNELAGLTLANSGGVLALDSNLMPSERRAAGIFRY